MKQLIFAISFTVFLLAFPALTFSQDIPRGEEVFITVDLPPAWSGVHIDNYGKSLNDSGFMYQDLVGFKNPFLVFRQERGLDIPYHLESGVYKAAEEVTFPVDPSRISARYITGLQRTNDSVQNSLNDAVIENADFADTNALLFAENRELSKWAWGWFCIFLATLAILGIVLTKFDQRLNRVKEKSSKDAKGFQSELESKDSRINELSKLAEDNSANHDAFNQKRINNEDHQNWIKELIQDHVDPKDYKFIPLEFHPDGGSDIILEKAAVIAGNNFFPNYISVIQISEAQKFKVYGEGGKCYMAMADGSKRIEITLKNGEIIFSADYEAYDSQTKERMVLRNVICRWVCFNPLFSLNGVPKEFVIEGDVILLPMNENGLAEGSVVESFTTSPAITDLVEEASEEREVALAKILSLSTNGQVAPVVEVEKLSTSELALEIKKILVAELIPSETVDYSGETIPKITIRFDQDISPEEFMSLFGDLDGVFQDVKTNLDLLKAVGVTKGQTLCLSLEESQVSNLVIRARKKEAAI